MKLSNARLHWGLCPLIAGTLTHVYIIYIMIYNYIDGIDNVASIPFARTMHCLDVLWNLRHFGSQRIGCAKHLSPTICLHHYLPWWWLATGQNSVSMHLLRFDCSWGISIVTDHRPLLACNWHKSIQITCCRKCGKPNPKVKLVLYPAPPTDV
jgi:hypothetical protein